MDSGGGGAGRPPQKLCLVPKAEVEVKQHLLGNADEGEPLIECIDDGLPLKMWSHEGERPVVEGGAGWGGFGSARKAHFMGMDKPYADGGGLCSPGRWAPGSRRLPGGWAQELLRKAWGASGT